MKEQFKTSITYFLQEGRENLPDCLRIAFDAAVHHNIRKVIIFTAEGAGIRLAITDFLSREEFGHIRLVAVTFPVGKRFTDANGNPLIVEIGAQLKEEMARLSIPIVRAHLPFDPITGTYQSRGVLGQDLTLVSNALNVFGGSMSLCVQAILLACDSGEAAQGEHVIAVTSDTAILAQACTTAEMLRRLAIREILCKPAVYTIGRGETAAQLSMRLEDSTAGMTLLGEIAGTTSTEGSDNSEK